MSKANLTAESLYFHGQIEFIEWLKEKTSSPNFVATAFVIALHCTLLFAALYNFSSKQSQPVLSFTVTMMDVSSSSNTAASSAAIASSSSAKAAVKVEEKTNAAQSAMASSKQNLAEKSESNSKAAQAVNSVAQSAVITATKPAVFDAAYLNNPAPVYPALSHRLEEQGTVVLRAFVSVDGKAEKVELKESSGHEMLDAAALETVKKWRFIAAKNGDKLVASWVQVPVKFSLER